MRAGLIIILIISAALISATTVYARENTTNSAIAVMKDAKGNTVGLATFTEECNGLVRINANVKCLEPGMHGIHIHEKGDCTGPDFTSAGGHYNPLGKEHGLNNPQGPHAGDLPNLEVGKDRADGSPRCVACLCCSTACPAQCIYIEPAEYEPDDPRYGYERYPKVFVIDELRCIFCGFCVEACPCDAIRMDTGVHMPPSTKREHFIFDKETLMSIPGKDGTYVTANPRHEPGDPTYPGIDRERTH